MSVKQGEENTELIKDPQDNKRNYIFQKNTKTQVAIVIIAVFLLISVAALVLSGVMFQEASQ